MMTQIIYGDILFIINFSMDFLALYITGKILHTRIKTLALILSASIGAVYAIASLFIVGNGVLSVIISVCVSVLMCYIAYGAPGAMKFIKYSMLFYLVNFLMGGGITALYNLLNGKFGVKKFYINGSISEYYGEIPPEWFVILTAVSALFSFVYGKIANRYITRKSSRIKIVWLGKSVELDGLCDSGNLLHEPIGGLPVIIADYETIESVIPSEYRTVLRYKNTGALENMKLQDLKRIRIIPVSSLGYSGIIMGFIPDSITVDGIEREACVAVDAAKRYKDFGGFCSLVPNELII